MNQNTIRWLQYGAILLIATVVFGVANLASSTLPAHALPEFAARTGESCSTCHISPGGGGPLTLRGLLWSSRGRPDQVPPLTDMLIAPGVEDGAALYEIACAACHGGEGRGSFGGPLADTSLGEPKIRASIERGRKFSGMPAYEGKFTEEQFDALVTFVAGLASGETAPLPDSYPLPPAEFSCDSRSIAGSCRGN